jgi:xenotropic and polytropic retrovirus receptor 1
MFLDPIMRSSWIFYVAFPGQKQHSAATSFFIALGEVFRRFIWNFFRMENEHMTNVGHFIAARDVPLPFSLPSPGGTGEEVLEQQLSPTTQVGGTNLGGKTMGSVRRGMVRMTSSLRIRHAEDFARKAVSDKTQKGKLPDESDEYSSDGNGDEVEVPTEGTETRNVEMRDIEEEQ